MPVVVEFPTTPVRPPPYPWCLPEGLERQCWDSLTRELVAKQIWDTDITDVCVAYCIQLARFLEANRLMTEFVLKSRHGKARHNPYLTISNLSFDRMVRLMSELGITPATRSRVVKIPRASPAHNKFLK
jgi:P27 family predicted phage terminase small subunit